MSLTIVKCNDCKFMSPPPFPACPSCGSTNKAQKQIDGSGTIYTYTIVRMGFGEMVKFIPYVLAVVEVEDGMKMTTVLTRKTDFESIKIGDEVIYSHTEEGIGSFFKLV